MDLDIGSFLPTPGGIFEKSISTGYKHLDTLPVYPICSGVISEGFVQRWNAVEYCPMIALDGIQNIVKVGGGEYYQGVALGHAAQHNHRLAVDVVERQICQNHLLALLNDVSPGYLGYVLCRHNIIVGYHSSFW